MREVGKSLDGAIDAGQRASRVAVARRTVNGGTFEIVDEAAW
jgi:hypothetical protein